MYRLIPEIPRRGSIFEPDVNTVEHFLLIDHPNYENLGEFDSVLSVKLCRRWFGLWLADLLNEPHLGCFVGSCGVLRLQKMLFKKLHIIHYIFIYYLLCDYSQLCKILIKRFFYVIFTGIPHI